MNEHQDNPRAAYLSALRRNYTFDTARAAVTAATEALAAARQTLALAGDLRADLGVIDRTLLAHSIRTLRADLDNLRVAMADTGEALDNLSGLPHRPRTSDYVAADGVSVVQIDTDPPAAVIRVNLNDTCIHDAAPPAPAGVDPSRPADFWPTEAGLLAMTVLQDESDTTS